MYIQEPKQKLKIFIFEYEFDFISIFHFWLGITLKLFKGVNKKPFQKYVLPNYEMLQLVDI